tara:strand:+ start:523 stop:1251 length:729 start_codon:yes stop_codon:yes gene_type:complete
MKVFILAGGFGTRLSEYTKLLPKPMIKINKKPILVHIMDLYLNYGYRDFYILMGYKSFVIKKYFSNFKNLGKKFKFSTKNKNCSVTLIESGLNTLTGGRLKKAERFLKKNENFMFSYGDGVSSVNLKKLEKFYIRSKKLIAVTAVRPPARFGELTLKKNKVIKFKEKPQVSDGWINGGFFIANKNFLKFIKNKRTILEKDPLEKASRKGELVAFKHKGFWKCMDTLRDKNVLEKIYRKNGFK